MAKNPFDQFDTATAANPFDAFDGPAAPPQGQISAPPAAAATSGPVGGEATGTVLRPRWMDAADEMMAATAGTTPPPPAPEKPGFFSQLGKSFMDVGVPQLKNAATTINTVAQDDLIRKTQEQLAKLEATGQGASPQANGLRMTLDHYTKRQGTFMADLAQQRGELATAPVYPGVQALSQAPDFGAAWDVLKADPLNIIANLGMQSLPTMLPGLAVGMVNPVAGAVTMGASSGGVELGASIMEFAQKQGVDTSNVDQLRAFFADPAMQAEARKYAATRAGIIGTVDGLSAGLASKTLVPQAIKGPVARGVTNLAVQIPTQAAAGAAGEAGAQVATEGGITAPGEVVAEGAGGLFTAPLEVAALRAGVRREQEIKDRKQAAAGGVDESITDPAALLADAIDFNARRTTTNQEAARQTAVDLLSPDRAQYQFVPAQPQAPQPSQTVTFDDLVPTNMPGQPTATMGQPGQTVQAGPGFTAANVLPAADEPANAPDEITAVAPPEAAPAEAPAPANRAEYLAEVRRQLSDIQPGDTIENDAGDVWTVDVVLRNKAGEITGVLHKASDDVDDPTMDLDMIGSILLPAPYIDANGNRQMSGPGKVNRAQAAPQVQQPAPAVGTTVEGAGESRPTQVAPSPIDELIADLPPETQAQFKELARLVDITGFTVAGGEPPKWHMAVRQYRDIMAKEGPEAAQALIDGTRSRVLDEGKNQLLGKALKPYFEKFEASKTPTDAQLIAAIKNGALDISGEPWAPGFYEVFKIDPAKIQKAAPVAQGVSQSVSDELAKMRAGLYGGPSYAAGTGKEGKATADAMNKQKDADYYAAARLFLEGSLTAKVPTKSQDGLAFEVLQQFNDIRPQPIEKKVTVAKDWLGVLKVADIITPDHDIRYYLMGIRLNEQKSRIEATDGHRALLIETDLKGKIPKRPEGVPGDTVYVGTDGQWAKQKDGKPVEGTFPDIDRVVPANKRTREVSFDSAQFAAQMRGIEKAARYFNLTKTKLAAIIQIDNAKAGVDPSYLADMAEVFQRLGYDKFNLSLHDEQTLKASGALLATSPDGKVKQVVMPVRDPVEFFAPIVGDDAPAIATPPTKKPTTRKKKAVAEFLADEGITDPAVVDAVAAEYDRLTGDDDVQDQDAGDAAGAAQRGPVDEPAGAVQGGEQAEQQGLFQGAANPGRPAQGAPAQRGADQPAAGAVNDRAVLSAERDTGATPADRGRVREDNAGEANQRVRGAGQDAFNAASFTDRQSIWRDAFVELGYDPAQAELLPPARQYEILRKGLKDSFGLAEVQKSERANIRLAIDQLLDAYRGLQFMTHVLDLPTKAIGLNGTLALGLSSQGKYLGAYYPQGTDRKSADGIKSQAPTIVLPGRSNSFAHEWGHALDYYIAATHNGSLDSLASVVRNGGPIHMQFPENVRDSFRLLMNALFFDQAEQSAKIMQLEQRIEAAAQRNVDATALKAELARIKEGASRSMQGRSQFYQTSRDYDGQDYWLKPTEMLARSFEAYIAHKVEAGGGTTEFLAKGDYAYLNNADDRLAKTFPKDADRFNIFRAYDLLFDAIREEALLGTGPVANAPQSIRLSDPSVYYDDQISNSTGPIKAAWDAEKRAWVLRKRQLQDIADRPKDTRSLGKRMTDPLRTVLMTNRGVLLLMERQYRKSPAAVAAIRAVRERIATNPGSGQETFADGTFAEAVDREHKRFMTRLSNIVGNNNLDLSTPAQRAAMTNVLTAIGNEPMNAPADVVKAAAPLRELVNDLYYYNRNAGLDIGYVENGYLPRLIDEAVVTEKADEFIRDATMVYRIVYERDTQRPSDADEITDALKALDARMKEAMIRAKDDPNLASFVAARKELNKRLRALDEATNAAEPDNDVIAAAQADLDQFLENAMEVFDEAYDYVGNIWSQQAAAEYQTRISYGSPENFSSHSPAGSFLKERTLPPEADKILARYYIQDPVERISRYIDLSVRKAEYNRRFGRDARGKETNSKLYRMLNDMIEAKVLKSDRDMVEKIVGQVTGTDRSTIPQQTQNMLGAIHAIGQMTMLGRVVLTSLAEPITTAVQTGRPLDAFRAVALTIQEIANTGSVRERRMMARALGIVSGDMADEIISNRLGGQVGETGMVQRASAQFFRRIGLTGLTNAQRRAAMQLSGRYVLDLAHVLDDTEASANEQSMARAELIDAGLTDDQIQSFVEWSREFDGRMPRHDEVTDVDGTLTPMGKIYAIMVGRLAHQSIQSPTAIDRPYMANTVYGRLVYGLLSFVMAFYRNVVIKSGKKIAREYGERGPVHASKVAAVQVLAPLATLYAGHLLVTVAREALLNPEKWEEEEKKGNLEAWLMQLAFSRTGFTGLADPLYNAMVGVKYQRDLVGLLSGPSFNYFGQALQRIATYFVLNSENTNSAERGAARGLYELGIQPAMAFGVGYLPGGPLLGYGMGAAYAYMSSPAFKSDFQDLLAGEKDSKKAKTGEKRQGNDGYTGGF
jgi:hypothetical protein